MVIDENRKYILTNYEKAKKGGKSCDTDHATEYMDLNLKVKTEKPKRVEVWNFKNKEAQNNFRIQTSETKEFSSCFDNNLPVLEQIKLWKQVFDKYCRKSFKKVRLTKKKFVKKLSSEISTLIDKRNQLMKLDDEESKLEAKHIDEAIATTEAEANRNKIIENFQSFSQDPENVNLGQVWKVMNKVWPKFGTSVPSAKKDHKGRIVSEQNELKKLLAKE